MYENLCGISTRAFSIYHTFQYNAKYTYSTLLLVNTLESNQAPTSIISQHVDKRTILRIAPRPSADMCNTQFYSM